jgi:F0F1-type ATP synthase epsilon subunit
MKLDTKAKLHTKIISPAQTYYDGPAVSVSAVNKVGTFDILADHANFFSLLTDGDIVINTGSQTLRFPVTHGIVRASHNNITLFIYLPDET